MSEKSWSDWNAEGSSHFKNQKWLEAISCYTRAINLNTNEAFLYSNRAICETKTGKLQLAREDAEFAIRLNPNNVKFYRVLSEALVGLESFPEALEACENGLKLDPRDAKLLIRQRDCRAKLCSPEDKLKSKPNKDSHASCEKTKSSEQESSKSEDKKPPSSNPRKSEESSKRKGGPISLRDLLEGSAIVAMGHSRMRHPNHDEEGALNLYQQAAERGSSEGMFYVGLMHYNGKAGLSENPKKALELWRQAAGQEAYVDREGYALVNQGVAFAQNAIGNAYRDGKGIKQSDEEAIGWYHKSAKNRSAEGCSNLGTFLYFGRGTREDRETAHYWFNVAHQLEQGKDLIGNESEDSEDEMKTLKKGKLDELLKKSLKLGRENGKAQNSHGSISSQLYFAAMEQAAEARENSMKSSKPLIEDVKAAMMERYLQGSPSAKLYLSAMEHVTEARELLEEKKYNQSFLKLLDMWRTWNLDDFGHMPFFEAACKVMEKEPNNHLAIYVYANIYTNLDFEGKLKCAQRCIQLDPSVPEYHYFFGACCAGTGNLGGALDGFGRAIELSPQPDFIYTRAIFLKAVGHGRIKVQEVIEAFQHYLSCVPSDYPSVPEAYYCLAELYAWQNDVDFVTDLYRKGLEAEDSSVRLPSHEDSDVPAKRTAKIYLKLRGRWPLKDNPHKFIKICAACTKIRSSLLVCSKCRRTWYCSEKCQSNHQIIHGKSCPK